ncbi:hypothetical protein [Pseudalkalibacillus hwajinpoensis]|uniref:Uncharacterized protein n=1 Tax=Guptibacillus hwajinpoensis TaxID=208199 RepID=A0A4U1MP69_9BACL|nr:hypothetical protein [Pseudalkalibacillus hwajinpoensis]TKD72310.1 hypothetical protein FBF83_05850 [Pseudalkalibacillus hwajinpoensis]
MKLHLLGDDMKIVIEVMGRSHPDRTDYWDGNWVFSNVTLQIPGYKADFCADLRTDEFLSFQNQLKDMDEKMKGKALLDSMEGAVKIEGKMNLLGKLMWTCETCHPIGTGAVLQFEFDSDQSYLPKLIKELEGILTSYLVIGKP